MPPELISILDAQELELLISGLPDIDLADLRANTEYQGFKPRRAHLGASTSDKETAESVVSG